MMETPRARGYDDGMLELARCGRAFLPMVVVLSGASCGDDPESATGGGGGTSASTTTAASTTGAGGSGGEGGMGGSYVCGQDEGLVLALTELDFGAGIPGGWKKIGMNIDGLVSDASSTDLCQVYPGSYPAYAYPDGDDGIDNAFGKNALPLIGTVFPDFQTRVNDYLETGKFNAMMKIYCLPPTGDAPQLTTKVFGGTDLGHTPAYDGSDVWPVAPELLSDLQDPESSTLVFPASSVIGDAYDSGPNVYFVLSIPLVLNDQEQVIKLSVHSARVTLTLSSDRKSATGVLAGVLNTEEAIDQLKKIAFMADQCADQTYLDALTLMRQMSDIMTDGTQDTTATCDGISFGVKFTLAEVQLGDVGPTAPRGMACP